MKKRTITLIAAGGALAIAGGVVAFTGMSKGGLHLAGNGDTVWKHYAEQASTPYSFGTKEYWVACDGSGYQFTAPGTGIIEDADGAPSHAGYSSDEYVGTDDRYLDTLAAYNFVAGDTPSYAGAYITSSVAGDQTWMINRTDVGGGTAGTNILYKGYENAVYTWGLPRVNFGYNKSFQAKVQFWLWGSCTGKFALAQADLADATVYSASAENCRLFAYANADKEVTVSFVKGDTVITRTIDDEDVYYGRKSIEFFFEHVSGGDCYFQVQGWTANRDTVWNVGSNYNFYGRPSWVGSNNKLYIQIYVGKTFAPTGNYGIANATDFTLTRGGVTTNADYTSTSSELVNYDGNHINFSNDWWVRRFLGIHASNWEDGDIITINGPLVNANGFGFRFASPIRIQLSAGEDGVWIPTLL